MKLETMPMPPRKSSTQKHASPDMRRLMALAISIAMLVVALLAWWFLTDSRGKFMAAACGRVGLVMGALWLAWPSLKRPANWLPASVPMIGVVALIVIAAQPRLIIPAIPLVGSLIAITAFAKAFRKR